MTHLGKRAGSGIGLFFFFQETATTSIYTLSLHGALPIFLLLGHEEVAVQDVRLRALLHPVEQLDRKSTRLNSSHSQNSYAVFCLKKKDGHRGVGFFLKSESLLANREELVRRTPAIYLRDD